MKDKLNRKQNENEKWKTNANAKIQSHGYKKKHTQHISSTHSPMPIHSDCAKYITNGSPEMPLFEGKKKKKKKNEKTSRFFSIFF